MARKRVPNLRAEGRSLTAIAAERGVAQSTVADPCRRLGEGPGELLCPDCHSHTESLCGRNRRLRAA